MRDEASAINWGSDGIATRLRNCLKNSGIEFVAQTLLIFECGVITTDLSTGTFRCVDRSQRMPPNILLRNLKRYGDKCHARLNEVLRRLDIDPNLNLTDFPWELLGPH